MWFMHLSLLGGWLPACVDVLAWASLLVGIAWWRRPAWHWTVIAAASGVGAIALAGVIDVPSRFGNSYPRSFVIWGALPLFAAGAIAWQWRWVTWWRRAVALASIPALAAFAAMQVNAHYGYLPTVGDLFGTPLAGQVDAGRLLSRLPPYIGGHRVREVAGSVPVPTGGVVAQLDLPALVSGFHHRKAWVWVPPVYFLVPRPRLPVLMLIAGTPGSPGDWLRGGGALSLANSWAATHHGFAPIMVLPDANGYATGDTECVNGPRGQAETYLSVDVPRYMIEHFDVAAGPHQWAIAGLSEGGTCALELVTRHPDRFSTFADFSGDAAPTVGTDARTIRVLYRGSTSAWRAHDPATWFARDASAGVQGVFAVGNGDHRYLQIALSLADVARADGLQVAVDVLPGGGHNFYTWKRALRDAYPWLISRVDTTNLVVQPHA